jgi:sugar phosphate isomerase/epimerase
MVAGAGAISLGSVSAAVDTSRMRLAICNETFGDWPFEKAFGLAADCGYRGIEIAPFTISDYVTDVSSLERSKVRKQAEAAGLEVVGLHWLLARTKGFHLTSPDPAVRGKTADYLGELARFCAELGGKLLIFGSPKQRNLLPGVSRAEAMRYAAEVIRAALPALDATDVTLAMEPLSPGTTDFLNTASDAAELVRAVDSPRCRLILDCNAMSTESTPIPELIRKHAPMLAHFHANDPNQQGPGFGKLDFLPILQTLGEVNYRGWISVEVFDYTPGAEELARRSIRYLQKCMAELAG